MESGLGGVGVVRGDELEETLEELRLGEGKDVLKELEQGRPHERTSIRRSERRTEVRTLRLLVLFTFLAAIGGNDRVGGLLRGRRVDVLLLCDGVAALLPSGFETVPESTGGVVGLQREKLSSEKREERRKRETHRKSPQVLLCQELRLSLPHHRCHPTERQHLKDVRPDPRAFLLLPLSILSHLFRPFTELDLPLRLNEGNKVPPSHPFPSSRPEKLKEEESDEEGEAENEEDEEGEGGAAKMRRGNVGDEGGTEGDGRKEDGEKGPEKEGSRGVKEERVRGRFEQVGEDLYERED